MDRRESLLRDIDIDAMTGLEIGPLSTPIIERTPGRNIYYADYADRATLQDRSRHDPHVDIEAIPEIDFIIAPPPEALPVAFDYIIASHVIEHVPDPIRWLNITTGWLKPGGRLILAVPDKRYCFDALRPASTIHQWWGAYMDKREKPTFSQVFEAVALHSNFGPAEAWEGDTPGAFAFTRDTALKAANASLERYVDCHCWAFTYLTFKTLIREAREIGLLKAQIAWSAPPVRMANEFHVAIVAD